MARQLRLITTSRRSLGRSFFSFFPPLDLISFGCITANPGTFLMFKFYGVMRLEIQRIASVWNSWTIDLKGNYRVNWAYTLRFCKLISMCSYAFFENPATNYKRRYDKTTQFAKTHVLSLPCSFPSNLKLINLMGIASPPFNVTLPQGGKCRRKLLV